MNATSQKISTRMAMSGAPAILLAFSLLALLAGAPRMFSHRAESVEP
jgi:hypothetical protein